MLGACGEVGGAGGGVPHGLHPGLTGFRPSNPGRGRSDSTLRSVDVGQSRCSGCAAQCANMLTSPTFDSSVGLQTLPAGSPLLRRGVTLDEVLHVEAGRVALGLTEGDELVHQLGVVQGPFWLEATAAVLGLPSAVDARAESAVTVRRVPLRVFEAHLSAMPAPARAVLLDVARTHRQQTELAVSRLAKDAEARCAEWLLRHAEPVGEPGSMAVLLRERKRIIAAQLGIAPETFSRVLRHLREQSLISGSGRVVNLVDPNGLRSLAGV